MFEDNWISNGGETGESIWEEGGNEQGWKW